ncbi:DNA polymerase Y family protein [Clostridium algidicarnis]|uniref:DNA polymerase Y family protein n=1 Tax=Clostridium algidicarnis TaxID=37659 RepID=UPI001C0CB98F|nr:DNA polymerase IV [Clostridium algidicarnis]MBU3194623.1 DNA polymerase IV [Clostridium algidicarnis]MBU3207928.1 DNA polymerase IV [Clostridium algidicarnis]
MERVILHADMNNCYASIETKLNPKLKGIPLAVCGRREDRHGIVLAKSQEAKVLGVKTGEAIWEAQLKCPDLLIVPPNYDEYLKHSRWARDIYYDYSNQVEPYGIDECWLDVSGSLHLFGKGRDIAEEIRSRIKKELGITVSIGVSFNKIFAKLGSDMKKPDAVTEIAREDFKEKIWNLPVEELLGVGKASKKKLNRLMIFTIGDLARGDSDLIRMKLGINGVYLWNYANGRDYSSVTDRDYRDPVKSVGRGITTTEDLENNLEVYRVFRELSFGVSKALRSYGYLAGGIQISVKNNNLLSKQYQRQISYPSLSSTILAEEAYDLFLEKYSWESPIRALTIRAINLIGEKNGSQLSFYEDYSKLIKREKVDDAFFKIRERFGDYSISYAGLMGDIKMPMERNEIVTLPGGTR